MKFSTRLNPGENPPQVLCIEDQEGQLSFDLCFIISPTSNIVSGILSYRFQTLREGNELTISGY
jgi:hypothetical protein